jgi:hypothetical protein
MHGPAVQSFIVGIPAAGSVIVLLAVGQVAVAAAVSTPTFTKEVAPILFSHCVTCHRPGEIAGHASLLSYDAARPWAKAMKQKVLLREMPPWPADPSKSAAFRNDQRLSQDEIRTIVNWADGGAPKGNDSDLPKVPDPAQGWLHPKGLPPDAVITLPEFDIPAKGDVPYFTYLAKVPFPDDRWVTAIQVRPGNRGVVHHMAITEIRLDDGLKPADLGPLAQIAGGAGTPNGLIGTHGAVAVPGISAVTDMLGIYTPGDSYEMYENGTAKLLKGGANFYINFNIHYQSTGKPEKDRSQIALWFQPRPPAHQLFRIPAAVETIIAGGLELRTDTPGKKAEGTTVVIPPIPPRADNYEVSGVTAYTEPVTIYQFHPHAHLRGKDFTYTIVYPDGREQTALSIPKYDFHWQLAYDLKTPLQLPEGSKLVVTAHYDNSANNKNNPDPDKAVVFREGQNQSWDEMFTPFIQYTVNGSATEVTAFNGPVRQSQNVQQHSDSPRHVLHVIEAAGCLEQGIGGTWVVTNATEPIVANTQATSSAELRAAETKPLAGRTYHLLGARFFDPSNYKDHKVQVKGVLITGNNDARINVTSLQSVGMTCPQ